MREEEGWNWDNMGHTNALSGNHTDFLFVQNGKQKEMQTVGGSAEASS